MFDLSIVLPTRNRADHLLQAIMGVERNTHCSYELIVVDGASTDSTNDVLMLAGSIMGPRLRVIREGKQLGFAAACNKGIGIARGRNVCVIHDDCHPLDGAFDRAVAQLDGRDDEDKTIVALFARPDAEMNIAQERIVGGKSAAIGHVRGTLIAEYPLARRQVFEALPFDTSLKTSAAIVEFSFAAWTSGNQIVPAIDAVLEEHYTDQPDCPISHDEMLSVVARWNLPGEGTRFTASKPCTVGGRARQTKAA